MVKGRPNMTVQSFCDWINNNLLISSHLSPYFSREISAWIAVCWLHHLGFKPVSHKVIYINSHEREDFMHRLIKYCRYSTSCACTITKTRICSKMSSRGKYRSVGEILLCEQEHHNTEDAFAVAMKRQDRSGTTVGHIPREISNLVWHFLQ